MKLDSIAINSAWLIADKIARIGLGLIVWIWLARHFGPEAFGLWNFAIAFTAIFAVIGNLGLDNVVVHELLREPSRRDTILGTAFRMRVAASGLAATASIAALLLLRPGEWLAVSLVASNAIALIFQSTQVVDQYFQSRELNRRSVIAANTAFLGMTAVRLLLLHFDAPLEYFAVSLTAEAALVALLLVASYNRSGIQVSWWHFDPQTAWRLAREGWPLLLSGLTVMIYMRLDQVMLAALSGDAAVGQFSAALRLAEVWYFIPAAIVSAAFPTLIKRKNSGQEAYERHLQFLYDCMAWLGVAVAMTVIPLAPHAISLIYGPDFALTSDILKVQIWAGIAVAMSYVHGRWLLVEGLQRYGLLYTALAACTNIALNLILIPRYGALGAAWSTLAAQIGVLPVQILFPRTRSNFILMARTVTAPWRLARSLRSHLGKRAKLEGSSQ